jgi:hypothetical protein
MRNALRNACFSYLAIVIPSNDAFIGNADPQAHRLFDAYGTFLGAYFTIYGSDVPDAGPEVNDEHICLFRCKDFRAASTNFLSGRLPKDVLLSSACPKRMNAFDFAQVPLDEWPSVGLRAQTVFFHTSTARSTRNEVSRKNQCRQSLPA